MIRTYRLPKSMRKRYTAGFTTILVVALLTLLVHNIDQFIKDDELCVAAFRGDLIAAKSLINKGANVNGVSMHWMTPLMSAAQGGHLNTVTFLIGQGANVNKVSGDGTALTCAASGNSVEITRLLLKNGANVKWTNSTGGTALSIAKGANRLSIVKLLEDAQSSTEKTME